MKFSRFIPKAAIFNWIRMIYVFGFVMRYGHLISTPFVPFVLLTANPKAQNTKTNIESDTHCIWKKRLNKRKQLLFVSSRRVPFLPLFTFYRREFLCRVGVGDNYIDSRLNLLVYFATLQTPAEMIELSLINYVRIGVCFILNAFQLDDIRTAHKVFLFTWRRWATDPKIHMAKYRTRLVQTSMCSKMVNEQTSSESLVMLYVASMKWMTQNESN